MTSSLKNAQARLSFARSIKVSMEGFFTLDAAYHLEYKIAQKPKTFRHSRLALCNLLEQYGFINGFKIKGDEYYVMPFGELRWEHIEDFMLGFSQLQCITFITEYEYRLANGNGGSHALLTGYNAPLKSAV